MASLSLLNQSQRSRALAAGLSSAILVAACATDPVYLGPTEPEEEATNESPFVAFECDEEEVNSCFVDNTLTRSEVETLFGRGEKSVLGTLPRPRWVYPLAESMHPRNLGLLTLHFEREAASDATYELIIGTGEQARRLYIPCLSAGGEGCVYQVPEQFWISAATAFAGQDVTLTLRAATSEGVSHGASLPISFSPQLVAGGLYYWSSDLKGLYRLVFGAVEAVPYVQVGSDADPQCAGCHALSRDGSTIAFTQGSADPEGDIDKNAAFDGLLKVARTTSLDEPLIDPQTAPASDSGMMSLSRDGSRVASAFNFQLELRNTETGVVLDRVASLDGRIPFFPEFSPNDAQLAVTLSNQPDSEIGVQEGSIALVSVQGDVFGEVTELVPATSELAHYYPSWSPDGKWIAFVSGPARAQSYNQAEARLRLVSVETAEVFDLNHASGPLGTTASWPKFTPFTQCAGGNNLGSNCDPDESIFFLSFSSRREYGLLANTQGQAVRSQLWMSPVFVERTSSGKDPSSPPIWIPYQSHTSDNHLGYWTEALRCNENYGCGFGQVCADNECVIVVK